MSNSAERDVIIALKLAADPQNQSIADKVTRQAEKVTVASVTFEKLAAADYGRIEAGRTDINKTESNKRRGNNLDEVTDQINLHDKLTEKLREAEQTRIESKQKASEATLVAIQGLTDMTEGAAKLGLVSEENLEKFSKNFIMIKEGIRIVKGFTDVIWKGREALVAMSTATRAQSAANNILATSSALTGPMAGRAGSRGVGVGGQVVAGAAGGAAARGGVAVASGGGVMASAKAAGATAMHGAKVVGVLAAELAVAAAAGILLTEGVSRLRRLFGDTSSGAESFTMALWGWWDASSKAVQSTKNLTKSEEKRQKRLAESQKFAEKEAARSRFGSELRERQNRVLGHRAFLAGETPAQSADRERQAALREVSAAQSEVDRTKRLDDRRGGAGLFVSDENRIRVAKELEAAQMRLMEAEKQRLSIVRVQNKQLEAQLKTEQERLKTTVEAGKSQKDRILEAFADLSPVIQSQVRKIAAKVEAGQGLTERDNRILRSAKLEGTLTTQFGVKKGKAAGGEQALGALGLFDEIKKANKEQLFQTGKISAQLGLGKSVESDIVGQSKGIAETIKKQTEARIRFEAEFLRISEENIKGLTQPILKAQQAGSAMVQKAAADASDAITAASMQNVDSMTMLLNTVQQGFDNMKAAIEQNELLKGAYQKP